MSETTVHHVNDVDVNDPNTVYIGRPSRRLAGSIWANPYRIGPDGTREQVIERYRERLMASPDLLARLPELRGRRLACWCVPSDCHGRVLAEMADAEPQGGEGRE